jgi:peptidoglycan/LPS O-acetylase OafA/YrhL
LDYFFGSSDNGVLLFFAISGFILGMPFAKAIFGKGNYPKLKEFYLRRITRLEPPYLLVLTALLLLNVFVIHRDTLINTLPHYFASFFYLHNIIYQAHPTLNFVFWTLEIEVQFYLLAPLLAGIFRLEPMTRRVILMGLIVLFGMLNQYFHPRFLSLYNYLHFFMAGFLAVDLFLTQPVKKNYLFDLLCVGLIICIYTGIVTNGILLAILLMLLIWLSSSSLLWHKILSLKWIFVIGGMCYSIYMLHQPLMAVFLNRFMGNDLLVTSIWQDFLLRLIIILALVFLVSAAFFILVERPCMQKDWYKKWIPSRKKQIV